MTKLTLFKNAEGVQFAAGAVVFTEGDPADEMFVVKSGEIEISVGGTVVRMIGEADLFGEMALVDDSPRSATARARTDAVLVPVDRRRFEFLVQHPRVRHRGARHDGRTPPSRERRYLIGPGVPERCDDVRPSARADRHSPINAGRRGCGRS